MRLASGLAVLLFAAAGCGGLGQASSSGVVPQPDAGVPAGGADAGAPSADAGPPDAGPAPDAGGVTAACADLLPRPGIPAVVHLSASEGDSCSSAPPDGLDGTVPLRHSVYESSGSVSTVWYFYRARDPLESSATQVAAGGPYALFAQPRGFLGGSQLNQGLPTQSVVLEAFDHSGHSIGRTEAGAATRFFADPAGGMVGIESSQSSTGWTVTYSRFDAQGKPEGAARTVASAPAGSAGAPWALAGISLQEGHALVLWGFGRSSCTARWLDRGGEPLTEPFDPGRCNARALVPLLDGSLALESSDLEANAFLTVRFPDATSTSTPLPEFLLDRTKLRELFLLPNGRGYALRQQGADHALELFSGAGEKCGELTTPELPAGPLLIGRDGTLVEQDYTGAGCTFRWYPQLFR